MNSKLRRIARHCIQPSIFTLTLLYTFSNHCVAVQVTPLASCTLCVLMDGAERPAKGAAGCSSNQAGVPASGG